MAKVASVTVEMIAEIASFTRNINKAVSETNSAVKKISGAFSSLQNIAVGFGAAFSFNQIIQEAAQSELSFKQLEATIRSTGGVAGVSAQEMSELAGQLQQTSTYSDEAIQNMESILLTFTRIGGDVVPRATQAIVDLSTKLGQDLQSSAVQVGKALNDPVKGITALQRVGVSFSEGQKDVIENLVKTGQVAQAQAIILKELEVEFGGAGAAARDTLDGALKSLSMTFGDLLEKIGLDASGGLRYGVELLITGFQTLTSHSRELEKGLLACAAAAGVLAAVQLPAFLTNAITGMVLFVRSIHPVVLALTAGTIAAVLFADEIAKIKLPDFLFGQGATSIGDAFSFQAQQFGGMINKQFPQLKQIVSETNKRMKELADLGKTTGNALAGEFGESVAKSKKHVKSLKEQLDELFQKDYQEGIAKMISDQKAADEALKSALTGMMSPWDQYTQQIGKLMDLAKQFPQHANDLALAIRKVSQEFAQNSPVVKEFADNAQKLKQEWVSHMDAMIAKDAELRKQASETIDMLDQKMADMEKGFFSLGDASKQLSNNIVTAFDQAIFSGKSLTDVVKNLGMAILRIAEQQFVLTPLQQFISSVPSLLGGFFKPSFANLGGGVPIVNPHGLLPVPRAAGGPLSAGQLSVVGERGPELFVPKSDGMILPNGVFGGSSRPNVSITVINQTNSRVLQQRTVNPDGSENIDLMIIEAVANGVERGNARLMGAFRTAKATGKM